MTEIKPGTPLPWKADFTEVPYLEIGEGWVVDSDSGSICTMDGPKADREKDARYIVHTANTHPSLIAGLREAREALAGLLAHPGTHHDRCIHWEEVGCDCEFSEITNGARTVIAKLDTLLSQEGQP